MKIKDVIEILREKYNNRIDQLSFKASKAPIEDNSVLPYLLKLEDDQIKMNESLDILSNLFGKLEEF